MTTDTSEKGLENMIMRGLTGVDGFCVPEREEEHSGRGAFRARQALERVMLTLLRDDTEVYKQFVENEAFRRQITDLVFRLTSA